MAVPRFFRRWFPRKSTVHHKSTLVFTPGPTLVVEASFDDLLAAANHSLRNVHSGSDPCQLAARQLTIQKTFCIALNAAATTHQLRRAQLAISSAFLALARANKNSKQRQLCLEYALNHIACAESQQASVSTVESLAEEYLLSATALLSHLSLDITSALSFWARAVKAAGRSIRLQANLRVGQGTWLLKHLGKCLEREDYKTALTCSHEAIIAVEAAIYLARMLNDDKGVQTLQGIQEKIRFIECCVLVTQEMHQASDQDLLGQCRSSARAGLMLAKYSELQEEADMLCTLAVQAARKLRLIPIDHDWFQEAEAMLRQREKEPKAQAAQAVQDEDILKALEPELQKMNAAKKQSARHLLIYLKQHHPPKFTSKQEPTCYEVRPALRKASIEYHPDRQQKYDRKWQILACEISKAVNEVRADYKD